MKIKHRGFTLIELLVVISIIGLLSSIVFSSLNNVRVKREDAERILAIKQLENALELFYLQNGYYPDDGSSWGATAWNGSYKQNLRDLENYLGSYIKVDFNNKVWGTYNSTGVNTVYFKYTSSPGNNYQNYALSIHLLSPSNSDLMNNDIGSESNTYEVGSMPKYCKDKYNEGWWGANGTVCPSGN